jgi:hypothetical protein
MPKNVVLEGTDVSKVSTDINFMPYVSYRFQITTKIHIYLHIDQRYHVTSIIKIRSYNSSCIRYNDGSFLMQLHGRLTFH